MIRKVLGPFLILFAFQALIQQGSSQNFCNVYMPFWIESFSPSAANGSSPVGPYTTTDIPELATATAFTVSFYIYNLVETFLTNSSDFVFLFQLSNQSTDSPSRRWLQAYYSAAHLYINHQTDTAGSTLVNHTAAIILPYLTWTLIHVEFDASASQIYLFSTDFATYFYQNTVTTAGAAVTPMGSNGQLFFGCMNGVVDMSCTYAIIFRPIFAPYSMKVAPYDTFAFMFGVQDISWYRFDNTGSPGTAQDYTTTAPANIGGSQPNFPSYTLGQEENGLSFSATNRIILPTNMSYNSYPPAAMFAVETFTFWMNIPTQTSNPAIIFTRYDSTNSIKYQIALDTANTVKVFIVGNSYFSSNLTIPASTWTLLIVSIKSVQVSAFTPPSGYWQTTFPMNQSILHQSTDTEYLGSTTSSFEGYLREFRVFSDSSLVNFATTEFSTCFSGCTYGIGFHALITSYLAPICLDPSTAPTCPSGQYLFSTNNNCYNCYYQCSACTGLSATDCNPCNASQELYLQPNDYCSTTCPTTYYPDTSTQTCESCVAHCDVCSNAESCTTCSSPHYLSQVDSLCYSSCPTGTYLNLGECYACPSNCSICSSGTVCTTCAEGYYLDQYLNPPYCSACPSNCSVCSSGTVCLICGSSHYLSQVDNQCYSTCPTGTYLNSAYCSACPSNCDICSSGTVCKTCAGGYYLDQANSICYSTCPTGTYLNSLYCSDCPSNCNACTNGTVCTSCLSGYSLQSDNLCYNNTSKDNSSVQTAIAVSNTIQTSMSYLPTASVIVLQFANTGTQTLSQGASTATTLVTSGVSSYNLFSYIALMKFASLFVLVNIPYRQRVLDFFNATFSNNDFPNIFSNLPGESSTNYFLTGAFSRITFQSQFLLNYGSYMTEILLYFLIALLFHMVIHIFRKRPKLSSALGKITTGFYNAAVINTIGSQIPFIMGAIVSFESEDGKSSISDNLGLVMLILMVSVWLALFSYFAVLLFKSEVLIDEAERENRDGSSPQNPGVSLKKMLAKGFLLPFISNRLGRQLALPLNLIKIMSIVMFVIMSQSYPLLQMIPGIILQLGWLILDAWSDSKRSKVDFVLNLLENFLLLMGFIACLLISMLKNVEAFDYVLIGVISTALILRTIHVITGLIGTVALIICMKKKPRHKSSLARNFSLDKETVNQISLGQKNYHDQASMSDSFSSSSINNIHSKTNNHIELVHLQDQQQQKQEISFQPRIQKRILKKRLRELKNPTSLLSR